MSKFTGVASVIQNVMVLKVKLRRKEMEAEEGQSAKDSFQRSRSCVLLRGHCCFPYQALQGKHWRLRKRDYKKS